MLIKLLTLQILTRWSFLVARAQQSALLEKETTLKQFYWKYLAFEICYFIRRLLTRKISINYQQSKRYQTIQLKMFQRIIRNIINSSADWYNFCWVFLRHFGVYNLFSLLISLQIDELVQYTGMPDPTKICYWQARSPPDVVGIFFNLFATLVIGVVLCYYYIKSNQKIRRILKNPYMGILLWIIVSAAKNIFSIVVYFKQIDGKDQATLQFSINYFRAFMILDTIPSITVQTFFLIIPYNMWLGVLKFLSRNRVERSLIEQQFVILFLYYLIIRMVILIIPLIAIFAVRDQILEDTNSIQLYFQLVDSLISSFILVFSISFFKSRFNQLNIESQKQKKKLIFQYTLMVVINFCRFILDVVFLKVTPTTPDKCFTKNLTFTIVYLFVATAITHFLPIGVIIKIYHPQQSQEEIQQQPLND